MMARRARGRESEHRLVRMGALPPHQCGICGRRFWTAEQQRAHDGGVMNGVRICLYTPARARED